MDNSCLNDIIGITRSDCDCKLQDFKNDETGLPEEWYKVSTSGLYLDELEGLVAFAGVSQSGECDNELAQFFATAKSNAIKALRDDLILSLTQKFKEAHKAYKGLIGGTAVSGSTILQKNFLGVRMRTAAMKGGVLTISKVFVAMDTTGTFDLNIYKVETDAEEYELVHTIEGLTATANQVVTNALAEPVLIDLSEVGADFFFLYEPTGFNPKNNSTSCGCGAKERGLKDYMRVSGVAGNDLSYMLSFPTYNTAMGLAFDATVGCDATSIVCEMYNNDAAVKVAMAYAARFKAGFLVHEYVLRSANINRYTMLSRDHLWGKRNHYAKEYNDRIQWMADNADISLVDCYMCNDKRVAKGRILA